MANTIFHNHIDIIKKDTFRMSVLFDIDIDVIVIVVVVLLYILFFGIVLLVYLHPNQFNYPKGINTNFQLQQNVQETDSLQTPNNIFVLSDTHHCS